jgi:hypothetical protein
MNVDTTAAARRADRERVREWLSEQRVFISSAMADTIEERRCVAAVVEELGARAVWFEEFGRDADAEEAYLTEVDASAIYIGILKAQYGRPNPPDGDSATEMEFRRARERGKRVNVYVSADADGREGALSRLIERVRFYITTENFSDVDDLARRVQRRLEELASEALSPWVKLGDFVFRADEIVDTGTTITLRARISDDIAHELETIRDNRYGRQRLRFVSRTRVAEGELEAVRRTTRAGGVEELTVELARVEAPAADPMRASTGGLTPDELVEVGVRALILGEPVPERIGMLHFMTDPGISVDDLREAFDLPSESAEAVLRLVLADGLVGGGNAKRVVSVSLGPRDGATRRIAIEWEDRQTYSNDAPARRTVEGVWHRPG